MSSLFGYAIESEFLLTRDRPAPSHRGVVEVRRAERPLGREGELVSWDDRNGAQLAVTSSGEELGVWCSSSGSFRLNASRQSVTADPIGDPEGWEHRLGSTVLPLLLGELGDLALHAAAVDVGGRALIVCGVSGAGKSTLAATLSLGGRTVLSEDGVVISGLPDRPIVWPGLDGVRVAATTFSQLAGDGSFAPDSPGKALRLQCGRPVTALPGGALVFLEARVSGRPVIEPVEPMLALPALAGHVLCPGRARLPLALQRSAALLDLLPAYKVALPNDLRSLSRHAVDLVAAVSETMS